MNVSMLLLLLSSNPDPTVLAAPLPPSGESAFALGVAVYASVPTLSVRYLHGLSESIGVDLAIDTAGVAQIARGGVRVALIRGDASALALRWSAVEAHSALGEQPIVLFGMGPGLILSFSGAGSVWWSLALDGALMASPLTARGPLAELRASAGLELPLGGSLGFVAEVGAQIFGDTDPVILPVVGTALRF
jgi:hypothetical protein